jgi:hypothetical protein
MGILNPLALGGQLFSGGSVVNSATITSAIFGNSDDAGTNAIKEPFQILLNNSGLFGGGSSNVVEKVAVSDVKLQTSTYNKIIPDVFGIVNVAGNVMWASQVVRKTTTTQPRMTKSGYESGGSVTTIRASFAIAICKGVVDEIKNVYANGSEIVLSNYYHSIYYGSDSQMPDGVMQSFLGTGNVPAFRGLCYVVFHDFPLENFDGSVPNFTFTVRRNSYLNNGAERVEDLVRSITLIPGSGEFVYDTVTQRKLNGIWREGVFIETSNATLLNNHTATANSNSIDSLNNLQKTFKNLEYVSLVVSWFGSDLNAGVCDVYPACEFDDVVTKPDEWFVAGISRRKAKIVGRDADGNMSYGGTPADVSVVRYVNEMRKRGLKVCLYPMLMMDCDKKPWRGRMFANSKNDIDVFFAKYRNFILHYSNLLKGNLDSIIIGSEMVGLTKFRDVDNSFPAVKKFCELARDVRGVVGKDVKITYAADWSEYHHTDGGWYNLDELWADENIDLIGIDAYFPLTNSADSVYDIGEIKKGWVSGEGFEFYYSDGERKVRQPLSPEWAWKNIEYFWANVHWNPDGKITKWKPKMKKIWFTEYGFPSVDCCTNEPNVFYSKGSLDSGFPRLSSGDVDFKAQRNAILATELQWQNSEFLERKFLYTWDARPYPIFPNLVSFWSDGYSWQYGHFVNGKIGSAMLSDLVSYFCLLAGLKEDEFDTSMIADEVIDGYIIDKKMSIISHLSFLSKVMFFDGYFENGVLYFKFLNNVNTHSISSDELLIDEKGELQFNVLKYGEEFAPESVEIAYNDLNNFYFTSTAVARDGLKSSGIVYSVSVPVPMTGAKASEVAWKLLASISGECDTYVLKLPIKWMVVRVMDVIRIVINNELHSIRVREVVMNDDFSLTIKGTSILENGSVDIKAKDDLLKTNVSFVSNQIAKTGVVVLDLYNCFNYVDRNYFDLCLAIFSNDTNWNGASIFVSEERDGDYYFYQSVSVQSTVGGLLSLPYLACDNGVVDILSRIEVVVQNENNKMISISDEAFYGYKNLVLIGKEIVAFRDVEHIGDGRFVLSHLLRGCFNTEKFVSSHVIGERVVLIDNDLVKIKVPVSKIGKNFFVKCVSNNDTINNTQSVEFVLEGNGIKNFDILNIYKFVLENGDIKFDFDRRANVKYYSNTLQFSDYVYYVDVCSFDNVVKRSFLVDLNNKAIIYYREMQIADFAVFGGELLNRCFLKFRQVLKV